MRASTKTEIFELVYNKRISQFWLFFSIIGLISGWLYSSAAWLAISFACLFWLVSASGLLWLSRNPGAHVFDFYRTPYWWLKLLDFEFKKEPKNEC
ncbi:TPA: hypothetical protein SAN82_005634 [Pseudomonas putida]|nr:hypothetical protein [Pseudomonas putida]